jgi:hypothetical protein
MADRRRVGRLGTALLTAAVALVLAATPAQAVTKTVTFDDLAVGTKVDNRYRDPHGMYFRGPDAGDGWFPEIVSAPGQAQSGTQVADVSRCAPGLRRQGDDDGHHEGQRARAGCEGEARREGGSA